MNELKTVWLCPKCDKQYFTMSRSQFDDNRGVADNAAKAAKATHKCPWELRRLKRTKGGANG